MAHGVAIKDVHKAFAINHRQLDRRFVTPARHQGWMTSLRTTLIAPRAIQRALNECEYTQLHELHQEIPPFVETDCFVKRQARVGEYWCAFQRGYKYCLLWFWRV